MTINLYKYYKQNQPFCKILERTVKSQLLKEHYLKLLKQYNFRNAAKKYYVSKKNFQS